jgi:hypothetical protein
LACSGRLARSGFADLSDSSREKQPLSKGVSPFGSDVGALLLKALESAMDRQDKVTDVTAETRARFIHSQTCVTRWEGELMDRHLAAGLLCDLDR